MFNKMCCLSLKVSERFLDVSFKHDSFCALEPCNEGSSKYMNFKPVSIHRPGGVMTRLFYQFFFFFFNLYADSSLLFSIMI